MSDLYIVYAVTSADRTKVRVSELLPWGEAVDRWYELDDLRRAGQLPQVRFFAVRSEDDPEWPTPSNLGAGFRTEDAKLRLVYTKPAVEHGLRVTKALHGSSYRWVEDEAKRAELIERDRREHVFGLAVYRAYKDRGGASGAGGWFYEPGLDPVEQRELRYRYRRGSRRGAQHTPGVLCQGYHELGQVAIRRGWVVETERGWARVLVESPAEVTS